MSNLTKCFNKDIGYLPGDIQSKLNPYMQPLYDNLGVIQHQFSNTDNKHLLIKELLDDDELVIAPLSYIRGRSLVDIYFIVDEAQNLTPHEVKTIITRAGENTKIILTGDIYQIDSPYMTSTDNGLAVASEKFRISDERISSSIFLDKGERSRLATMAATIL